MTVWGMNSRNKIIDTDICFPPYLPDVAGTTRPGSCELPGLYSFIEVSLPNGSVSLS